jgi:D-glycero-alpha-D-manno-heptose 1-phosphate guanylyltransferase
VATDEAIVLVGGLGTRLRKVISDVPKPLAPVAGRPFLAWVLDRLAHGGMRHVILAAGYMADRVRETVGTEWSGMRVNYSIENSPLGTGGAIRQACVMLERDAVHVLNGDTFTAYDPAALERETSSRGATLGMALAQVQDTARYGAVIRDGTRVIGFSEKGTTGPGYVNAGSYFLTREAIEGLPDASCYSFETEVLAPLVAEGSVIGFDRTSDFIDIGVPEDYKRAQTWFSAP